MIPSSRRLSVLSHCLLITGTFFSLLFPTTPYVHAVWEDPKNNPTIENLAAQLLKANSSQELQQILTQNRNLVSHELVEMIANSLLIDPVPIDAKLLPKAQMLNQMLLGLSQQVGHEKGAAIAVSYLGVIHRKAKQFDLAIRYFNQSLPVFQKLGDRKWIGQVHRYLLRAYYEQKDFSAALGHAQKALELAEQLREPYGIALANYNIGTAYDELELYTQALQSYQAALSNIEKISVLPPKADLPGLTEDSLRSAARVCYASGDIQCANDYYSKLVDTASKSGSNPKLSEFLNLLATAQHESGNFEAAKQSCLKSLAFSEPAKATTLQLNSYRLLGFIHSDLKNHAEAISYIEKAKALSLKKDKRILENLYLAEGVIYFAAGQFDRAHSAYDQSIKLVEERQAEAASSVEAGPMPTSYLYAPYSRMIELLVSQGRILEALNYSERAKGRYLFDLLNAKGQFAESALLERQSKLSDQILNLEIKFASNVYSSRPNLEISESLQAQISQAKELLKSVESEIAKSKITIAENRPEKLNLTQADLSALLPDNETALLQFAIGKKQTYLFVATKSAGEVELQAYPIKTGKFDLSRQVTHFRNLVLNHDQTGDLHPAARKLYDDLLGQTPAQLKSVKSLIIVPDGSLWELPFQALEMPPDKYLIERHAISYAPSFNLLKKFPHAQTSKLREQTPNRLLAFGNPALKTNNKPGTSVKLMDQPIDPLPETEKLVARIKQMYGVQKSLALIRHNATEDKFKSLAPRYSIIHVATHGLFNDLYPMRSRIVLSQTGTNSIEDGYLEAGELAKLKLQADLVILSACETGRGQVRAGEGIIGLPWAIFVAGCPTAIVSQWKVEVQSTADLMLSLHKNLNQPNQRLSKSEALQQSALTFINNPNKDLSHPFFWAGFIVMGKAN
jgi:CHAT domain-containing protein